ncbi:MAG: FecR domain-containing protein [Pseudomonadales bacterium]|nr:FecR domain-containing protein [Pseudomonadales bacterium]
MTAQDQDEDMRRAFAATQARLTPAPGARERIYAAALAEFEALPDASPSTPARTPAQPVVARWPWALAATVLFALAGSWLLRPVSPAPVTTSLAEVVFTSSAVDIDGTAVAVDRSGVRLEPGQRISTAAGVRAEIRMGDGMSLRLDENSSLRADGDHHVTLLRGRLYVDNQRDGQRLRLSTPFGEIRDVGTQFEAAVSSNDLRVAVREGAVVVATGQGEIAARADAIHGDTLRLDATGTVERGTVDRVDAHWTWIRAATAPYPLAGNSVDDVLTWVCRENGLQLRYAAEAVAMQARQTTMTGPAIGVPRADAIPALLRTTGYSADLHDNQLHVDFQR